MRRRGVRGFYRRRLHLLCTRKRDHLALKPRESGIRHHKHVGGTRRVGRGDPSNRRRGHCHAQEQRHAAARRGRRGRILHKHFRHRFYRQRQERLFCFRQGQRLDLDREARRAFPQKGARGRRILGEQHAVQLFFEPHEQSRARLVAKQGRFSYTQPRKGVVGNGGGFHLAVYGRKHERRGKFAGSVGKQLQRALERLVRGQRARRAQFVSDLGTRAGSSTAWKALPT